MDVSLDAAAKLRAAQAGAACICRDCFDREEFPDPGINP